MKRARSIVFLLLTALLASCASPPPQRFHDVDYRMGDERDVVVDGVRLRVHESGPEGAPTIVLLHCFGLTMEVWRDLVPLLNDRYHVVAYDAFGHGKSARGARRLTLPRLARLGLGLLDALGVEQAVLIGNSMGGGTALHMALYEPGKVRGLVLVDAVGLADQEWFIPLWPALSARHVASGADWTWDLAYSLAVERRSALSDDVRTHVLATRGDDELRGVTSQAMYSVVSDIFRTDLAGDLRHVRAPTLVVAGRHDRLVTVEHAERLARGIDGARLEILEPLGHLPEIEDAALLASVVRPFVDELAEAP